MRGDDQLKLRRHHGGEEPEIFLILENTLEERVQIIRQLENEVAVRGQIEDALARLDGDGG